MFSDQSFVCPLKFLIFSIASFTALSIIPRFSTVKVLIFSYKGSLSSQIRLNDSNRFSSALKKAGCRNLAATIEALKTLSVGLVAVTMPYKELIFPYLDCMSNEVEKIKAANTIIVQDGKLSGHNTDVDGIAYVFREISFLNKNVLIIGAGGASRAAAYYLNQKQANIFWLNRTPEHLFPLLEQFGGSKVEAQDVDQLPIDIIINATPLGMFPAVSASPLPHYRFQSHQIVFDMIYNPMETRLIKQAKSHGAVGLSGLDMFVGQGLKQIELWLKQPILTPEQVNLIKNKLNQSLSSSLEPA